MAPELVVGYHYCSMRLRGFCLLSDWGLLSTGACRTPCHAPPLTFLLRTLTLLLALAAGRRSREYWEIGALGS